MGKKKKHEEDIPHDDDRDEDPFSDEFFHMLNEQFKQIWDSLPFKLPFEVDLEHPAFKQLFKDLLNQMGLSPKELMEMSPEDLANFLKRSNIKIMGPFPFNPDDLINLKTPEDIQRFFSENLKKMGQMGAFPWGAVDEQDLWEEPDEDFADFEGNGGEKRIHDIEADTAVEDQLVDVFEEGDYVVCVCEVPGVEKEDIVLQASESELEIRAKSRDGSGEEFHKVIPLPVRINPDKAIARYKNGILEVKLKKIGDLDKTRIEIE